MHTYFGLIFTLLNPVINFSNSKLVSLLDYNASLNNPFVSLHVFPHGGITLDPKHIDYSQEPSFGPASKKKAIKLNNAMRHAAKDLMETNPDLIILSTPHGFYLQDKILILASGSASGDAGDGVWSNFTVDFNIDYDLSLIFYTELNDKIHPVEFLTFGNGRLDAPLFWGEVIPLYFIQEAAEKAGLDLPPVIYIGQPPNVDLAYQLNIGRSLARIAILHPKLSGRRIALVVSGDMSHYHGKPPNGTNENFTPSPYPFNPIGRKFDYFILKWAKLDRIATNDGDSKNSSVFLLSKAASIQHLSGHCGYNGLVMLHGVMDQLVNQKWSFQHKLYAYDVPTYFGMIVCRWTKVEEEENEGS